MNSNFIHYKQAADHVQDGWLRGGFRDEVGRVCAVQGVLESLRMRGHALPAEMIAELDGELVRYPYYRFLCTVIGPEDRQRAIMGWNDAPWRRKQTVVDALRSLGTRLEFAWLEDERLRLSIEVSNLKLQLGAAQKRIERLERENKHLWKRLLNYRTLRSDKETLKELEAQFDETSKAYEELLAR